MNNEIFIKCAISDKLNLEKSIKKISWNNDLLDKSESLFIIIDIMLRFISESDKKI